MSPRARRSLTPTIAFDALVSHQPLEALLVAIVLLFPAGEVADVALFGQQTRPGFRGLHHGIEPLSPPISSRWHPRIVSAEPCRSRIASSMASMIFAALLGIAFPAPHLLADECLLAF